MALERTGSLISHSWFENVQFSTSRGSWYTEVKWHFPHFKLWTIFVTFPSQSPHWWHIPTVVWRVNYCIPPWILKVLPTPKNASTSRPAFSKALANYTNWTEVEQLCSFTPKPDLENNYRYYSSFCFSWVHLNQSATRIKLKHVPSLMKSTERYLVITVSRMLGQMEGTWSLWSLIVWCPHFCIRYYYTKINWD